MIFLLIKKFEERLAWFKETYFNNATCNEDEKIKDFEEWCGDKDIANIIIFMKGLS